MRARSTLRASLLSLLILAPACAPTPEPTGDAPLETEDVSLPPDALVDPTLDTKEARIAAADLSGQLPSEYPADLPTVPGASVTDLGGEERWVEFLVAKPPATIATQYAAQLRAAGWELPAAGLSTEGGRQELWQGTRVVALTLSPEGPSTRLVVYY